MTAKVVVFGTVTVPNAYADIGASTREYYAVIYRPADSIQHAHPIYSMLATITPSVDMGASDFRYYLKVSNAFAFRSVNKNSVFINFPQLTSLVYCL